MNAAKTENAGGWAPATDSSRTASPSGSTTVATGAVYASHAYPEDGDTLA